MAAKKKGKKARVDPTAALIAKRKTGKKTKQELSEAEKAYIEGAGHGGSRRTAKKATKKQPNRTRDAQLATRVHKRTLEALRKVCAQREGKRLQPWRMGDIIEAALLEWMERHKPKKPAKKR